MSGRRVRGWLRIAGWNAGILLAGLIMIEVAFGNWVFGPNLGLLAVPRHVEITHVLEHVPGRPVARYTRDEFGLRGRYDSPSDIDVLVVGGSTTNELYVGDGDTFVDMLRKGLADRGLPLVVVNAGVDGHSTVGHLRAFDVWFSRIPDLRPNWLLFYVGINDIAVGNQARHDDSIAEQRSLSKQISRAVKNNSAMYQLFRTIRGAIRAQDHRVVHGADVAPTEFPAEIDADEIAARKKALLPDQRDALAQYKARLAQLIAKTEGMGARPVFITQRRGDVRYAGADARTALRGASEAALDAQLRLENLNDVTLAVCRDTVADCIDLGGGLRVANGDFYDPVHTTPAGSKRIGEFLADRLAPVFRP